MINITKIALNNIKRLQNEYGCVGDGLRFGLSGGGCSGYKYIIEFEAGEQIDDTVYSIGNEDYKISVYINQCHINKLKNSIIDWTETLMESGFKIENPQAKQPCGCGESVNFT
jgi:iron-sulfur cluster assembly accessory protein